MEGLEEPEATEKASSAGLGSDLERVREQAKEGVQKTASPELGSIDARIGPCNGPTALGKITLSITETTGNLGCFASLAFGFRRGPETFDLLETAEEEGERAEGRGEKEQTSYRRR